MSYLPEPKVQAGSTAKTAILLVNLGTPEAPTGPAVRRYLKQFLSDPRVIEIPPALWWPVLHGIVLNLRPRSSAQKYARIWSPEGSPLKVHTESQARLLRAFLLSHVRPAPAVEYAMRYGEPSILSTLSQLKSRGCTRILLLPLYPQYAASTSASAMDQVAAFLPRTRTVPEFRTVMHFHDHPAYISSLANSVREYWNTTGRPEKLLMSFHGLPTYTLARGDPYHGQCQETAQLLAQRLQLEQGQWQIAFQSRFGRTAWLQPYTASTLAGFGSEGVRRVDVICPGFVSDCLETLEEIGIEGRQVFLSNGGREFHQIPCLNERDDWIAALGMIVVENLGGWVDRTQGEGANNAMVGRPPGPASGVT